MLGVCAFACCLFCLSLLFLSVWGGVWGGHTFVLALACLYFILYIFVFIFLLPALFAASCLSVSVSVCPNSFNSFNSFEFVCLIGWVARSFGIRLTARMFASICVQFNSVVGYNACF